LNGTAFAVLKYLFRQKPVREHKLSKNTHQDNNKNIGVANTDNTFEKNALASLIPHYGTQLNLRLVAIKRQVLFKLLVFGTAFAVFAFILQHSIVPLLSDKNELYLTMAEIAVAGGVITQILSQLARKILAEHASDTQARSASSIIRIGGALIIIATIVIMLAGDPTVTFAVTTISGIALAISFQSIVGNAISGLVLAIIRPFKIGDIITVFGITASVRDVGLLYVRLSTIQENKAVLVPNGTMIGTAITKEGRNSFR
jgi:small-conductance mechanosensitive channel